MKRNIILCLAIMMLPVTAWAMTPVNDHELSNVTGQAGVTIYMDMPITAPMIHSSFQTPIVIL